MFASAKEKKKNRKGQGKKKGNERDLEFPLFRKKETNLQHAGKYICFDNIEVWLHSELVFARKAEALCATRYDRRTCTKQVSRHRTATQSYGIRRSVSLCSRNADESG